MRRARRAFVIACAPGKGISDVRFDNLFYADIAKVSYDEFAGAQARKA